MKKRNVLVSAVAVAGLTLGGFGYYLLSPSNYIALDINPSIELTTNRLNQVTSITPVNQDAKDLLAGYRLRDRDLDDVIEDLVDRMVLEGYITSGGENDVLVTVRDDSASKKTLDKVNAKIADYVAYRQLEVQVLGQQADLDEALRAEAEKYHISVGKMAVIRRLVEGDKTLAPSDLADMKVSDLLAFAVQKDISLEQIEEQLDRLEDRFDDNALLEELEDGLDAQDDRRESQYDDRDDFDDDWDDDDHDDDFDDDRDDDDHDDDFDDDRDDDDHNDDFDDDWDDDDHDDDREDDDDQYDHDDDDRDWDD